MSKKSLKEGMDDIKKAIKKKETELEGLREKLEKRKKEELEEKRRLAEERRIKELIDNVEKDSEMDKSITDFLKDQKKKVEQTLDKNLLIKLNEIIKEKEKQISNTEGEYKKLSETHDKIIEELKTSRENKNISEGLARELRMLPNKINVLKHQLLENKKIIESLRDKKNILKKFVYIEEIKGIIDEIIKCKERKDEIIKDKKWIDSKEILEISNEKEAEFGESLKKIKDAKTRLEEMKKTKSADILKKIMKTVHQ